MSIPHSVSKKILNCTYLDVNELPDELELEHTSASDISNLILLMQNFHDSTFTDINLIPEEYWDLYDYITGTFSPIILPYAIFTPLTDIAPENSDLWQPIQTHGQLLMGFIWEGEHPITIRRRYRIYHNYVEKNDVTLFPNIRHFLPQEEFEYIGYPGDYQIQAVIPEGEIVDFTKLGVMSGFLSTTFQSEFQDFLSSIAL